MIRRAEYWLKPGMFPQFAEHRIQGVSKPLRLGLVPYEVYLTSSAPTEITNRCTIEEDYNTSILFQLVLKGLGSVSGDSAVDKLKQSILGFKDEY